MNGCVAKTDIILCKEKKTAVFLLKTDSMETETSNRGAVKIICVACTGVYTSFISSNH